MLNHTKGSRKGNASRRSAGLRIALTALIWAGASMVPALASGSFNLFGINTQWTASANYSYAVRVEKQSDDIINSAPRWQIPLLPLFKFPESSNFDDGDRNFKRWDPVHNRLEVQGQLQFHLNRDTGAIIGGKAFYDRAYLFGTANNEPGLDGISNDATGTINTYQNPRHFTSSARHYNGRDAELMSAYAYKTFHFGSHALDLRAGREVVAWGQSLFFSGIALAQNPADAGASTVPGATARDIILPSTQVSFSLNLSDKLTLLGQYKLLYRSSKLSPTGSYMSRSDLIGPGAKFAYGVKNPAAAILNGQFQLPPGITKTQLGGLLQSVFNVNINNQQLDKVWWFYQHRNDPQTDAPAAINVKRGGVDEPRNGGQWGVGLKYNATFTTSVGLYYLNYADPNPTIKQIYGNASVASYGTTRTLRGSDIGLRFPTSYQIKYYDNINLFGLALSTTVGGVSIGSETIYRHGADVLVDVNQPHNGPVPTPTRADTVQQLVNGIYSFGPHLFWDTVNVAGSLGYIHTFNIHSQPNYTHTANYDDLSFDKDAAAFAFLVDFQKNSVFPGWNMSVPITGEGAFYNHASLSGAFGSLAGQGDYRLGVGVNFTHLNTLTLGIQYSGFLGSKGDDYDRPLQDRDNVGVHVKYQF